MQTPGHGSKGSYRKQVLHMKGPGRVGVTPKQVSLDAGGIRKKGGGGNIRKTGELSYGGGRPKSTGGGRTGTAHFGENVGNNGGPGWAAPKQISRNGFRDPSASGKRKGFSERGK
jgi:hypothetical protein